MKFSATRTPASWEHGGTDAMPRQRAPKKPRRPKQHRDPLTDRCRPGFCVIGADGCDIAGQGLNAKKRASDVGVRASVVVAEFEREHPGEIAAAEERANRGETNIEIVLVGDD